MRVHTDRDRVPGPDATYSRIRAQAFSPKDTLHFMEKQLTDLD